MHFDHFDIYRITATEGQSLPYVCEGIPAGFPSPATDYVGDRIDLNEILILNPGVTYYARVRDYYLVEEELEQGDGILFDTSLVPRSGDLALCEIEGERVLKYIRKQGHAIWLTAGGTGDTLPVDGDSDTKVLGIVTPDRITPGCAARCFPNVQLPSGATGSIFPYRFFKQAFIFSPFEEDLPENSALVDGSVCLRA